jgi:hypothetical protein
LELRDRFGKNNLRKECTCGKVHREMFWGRDGNDDTWPEIRDIIIHWVAFGNIAYGDIIIKGHAGYIE